LNVSKGTSGPPKKWTSQAGRQYLQDCTIPTLDVNEIFLLQANSGLAPNDLSPVFQPFVGQVNGLRVITW